MRMSVRRNKSSDSVCSDSSTVCVHKPGKELVLPHSILLTSASSSSSAESTHKKSVRFDERQNLRTRRAANSRAAKDCWYTVQEYDSFKAEFKHEASKAAKNSSSKACSFRRVLSSVFITCSGLPTEVDTSKTSLLCEMDLADLKECFSGSYWGLEQVAVSMLREEKKTRKAEQVRFLQKIQKESTFVASSVLAEKIRHGLEPLSRPCRLFAIEKARAIAPSCQ